MGDTASKAGDERPPARRRKRRERRPRTTATRPKRRAKRRSKLFKTADLLAASGVSRQVLYTYLTMGLIHEVERTPAGHRLYDRRALERIALIKSLNAWGYPLRDLRDIFRWDLKRAGDAPTSHGAEGPR